MRHAQQAGILQVAIDAAVLDQGSDRAESRKLLVEQRLGAVHTPTPAPVPQRNPPDAGTDIAAVAAAAAPAGHVRLQDDDVGAVVPGKVIGAAQAGVSAADDGDVRLAVLVENAVVVGLRAGGRRPIAVRKGLALAGAPALQGVV